MSLKILRTDADLNNAVLFRIPVNVISDGYLIEENVLIEGYNKFSVKVADGRFLRGNVQILSTVALL
ncbi:hypothetical protein [Paenibacillus sp. MBLB4367]|uniref:hypothetical protein n=1 Tax=Paenibacillus sp. MBLB4367 TaxID=3384767 RepID=UPI0039083199